MEKKSATKRGCLILTALVIVIIILSYILPYVVLPKLGMAIRSPSISLAAETLFEDAVPGINITNGTVSLILVIGIELAVFICINQSFKRQTPQQYVPHNFMTTLLYMIVEFWDSQTKLEEKQKKRILPLVLTIFLFFAIANIIKMLPITETVGLIECAPPGQTGYTVWYGFLDTNSAGIVTEQQYETCESTQTGLFMLVPLIKGLATDINAPLAMALISIIAIQIWGFSALGYRYIFKFINLPALGTGKIMNFIVGCIETMSELIKPISLGLRITFVIFAGGMVLAVMSYLCGGTGAVFFYALELIIGIFQAFLFSMLVLVFGTQAVAHTESE